MRTVEACDRLSAVGVSGVPSDPMASSRPGNPITRAASSSPTGKGGVRSLAFTRLELGA